MCHRGIASSAGTTRGSPRRWKLQGKPHCCCDTPLPTAQQCQVSSAISSLPYPQRGTRMSMTEAERAASGARHEALTQLQVSRTLRTYQKDWFEKLRQEVFEQGRPYAIGGALLPHEIWEDSNLPFFIV